MIPYPDGNTFEEWAGRVVEDYAYLGITHTMPWKEFGMRMITYKQFANLPNANAFDDWREWARRCMNFFQ